MEFWNDGIMVRLRRVETILLFYRHLANISSEEVHPICNFMTHHSNISAFQHSNIQTTFGLEGFSF